MFLMMFVVCCFILETHLDMLISPEGSKPMETIHEILESFFHKHTLTVNIYALKAMIGSILSVVYTLPASF